MKWHTTKDGKRVRIRDMTDDHLLNTISFHRRKAKEGLLMMEGSLGVDPNDIDYDEYYLYGVDALEELGHFSYAEEANKRGILK